MAVITEYTVGQAPEHVHIVSSWASLVSVEDSVDLSWTGFDDMRGIQVGVQMADGTLGTPGNFGVGVSGDLDIDVASFQNGIIDDVMEDIGAGAAGLIDVGAPTVIRKTSWSIRRVRCNPVPVIDEGTMTQYRLIVSLYAR